VHFKKKPTAHEEASDATLQQQVSTTTYRAAGDTVSLFSFLKMPLSFFVSWWIFFFTLILPCVVVYGPHFSYIRFQLVCSTKMLAKSDTANIHFSGFICRFIIFLPNCVKTILSIIF
jgi:hypothetical protein